MKEQLKTPRSYTRTVRWSVAVLMMAALLVFAGAAFAQDTTPQADTPAAEVQKPDPGLVVVYVVADGPAAAAGVARGDIILAVDDDPVNTMPELMHVIRTHEPSDEIVISLTHGDEARSLSVTLGDNNGVAELGVMAVGSDMMGHRMDQRGPKGFDMPGRRDGQGMKPDMPFGRGGNPEMPGMPFGQGEGMIWMTAGEGALVVDVLEDGAAATAGIQAGDVITALNDAPIISSEELVALLGDHKPGDVVTVTYTRDGEIATAEVTLGAHPDDETKAYMGVQLAPAGQGLRMEAGTLPFLPGEGMFSGVMIADVTPDGPAATAGLEAGDLITAVNGEEIDNPQALVDAVQAAAPGDEMILTVQGQDDAEAADVTVTLGENDEGGALLGVQIGGAMRMQRGPGGMDFDFHGQQDGGRLPQFHFQVPVPNGQNGNGQNGQSSPDALFPQPSIQGQGA